jgi:hypothetical protein
MAKTDIVTPAREIFRVGDISYKRSVSEATFNRVAQTNNFIATYQTDIKEWKLNGSYSVATGITFFDGVASFFTKSEIVGIFFYNGTDGASGVTTFDLRWIDSLGVDQGSIFSTLPSISSAATNNAIGFKNLVTSTSISPTGVTLPVFSKTEFLEGESVYLVLNSAMVSALNCGLTIFYRPIS